ncbi:MAG: DUF4252 domain-containing protein [Pyrinomonadaceae bacterium]|nr:DUF4252 domain-containing protein [Pyrinomonadaceae bacterium]
MKSLSQVSANSVWKIAALAILVWGASATATAQTARIQTSSLDHLAAKASESVDVNIDESLMQLAAKVFNSKDPDEAKVKHLVSGLKGIYVKVFEFEKEGEYVVADLESIRSQLRGPGWNKIVNVRSKKEGSVDVYLMTSGSQVLGLAVLAVDAKEIAVVNILGNIDLERLSALEGQFGVPDLSIEKPKRKN